MVLQKKFLVSQMVAWTNEFKQLVAENASNASLSVPKQYFF